MKPPQAIAAILLGITLAVAAAKQGEPRADHNLMSTIWRVGLWGGILIAGGFFE